MLLLPPDPGPVRLDLCAPVGALLKEASRGGDPMRAAPEIAGDTVYARFAGLPAPELRARFARLLHSTWTRDRDGGWTLARSKEDRKAAAGIERELLMADLGRALVALPPRAEGSPVEAAEVYVRRLDEALQRPLTNDTLALMRGPADGLLADLLRAIGPEGLANVLLTVPVGEPVALSDVPTARERPFPPKASAEVVRYAETDAAFGRAVGEALEGSLVGWFRDRLVSAARQIGVSRVLLIARRRLGSAVFYLTTYDAQGATRGEVELDLDLAGIRPVPPPEGLGLPEALPPGDEAAVAAIATPGIVKIPALAPYRDPVARDPLEIRALPVLRAMKGDVLVALPDRVVRETSRAAMKTPAAFVAALARSGVTLRREGDLTVGEPASPLDFDLACMDRAALRTWVRGGAGKSLASLRAMGLLFARGGPAFEHGGLFPWYRDVIVSRTEAGERIQSLMPHFLRTVGRLSDPQWAALAGGAPVTIGVPASRLTDLDVRSRYTPRMLGPVPVEEGGPEAVPDTLLTGTAVFPRGLPLTTRLVLRRGESQVFWNEAAGVWANVATPVYAIFPHGQVPATGEITDESLAKAAGNLRFGEGMRTDLTFIEDFGGPVRGEDGFESDEVRGVRKGVLYSELSDAAREAIREEVLAVREDAVQGTVIKP